MGLSLETHLQNKLSQVCDTLGTRDLSFGTVWHHLHLPQQCQLQGGILGYPPPVDLLQHNWVLWNCVGYTDLHVVGKEQLGKVIPGPDMVRLCLSSFLP